MALAFPTMAAPKTVAEYLAAQPPAQRRRLRELRALVRAKAPDAVESISYGLPTYKLNGKALVYFGAWAEHCSVYALPVTGVPAKYVGSKGTIRLPMDEPLPGALLARLIAARVRSLRR